MCVLYVLYINYHRNNQNGVEEVLKKQSIEREPIKIKEGDSRSLLNWDSEHETDHKSS